MKYYLMLASFFLTTNLNTTFAQEVWSLERCINYALEHSLSLRQSRLDAEQAGINEIATKQLRLPSINGSTGFNKSFGRDIDPTTNAFINQNFSSQNLSLNGGVILFNGGRINSQIKRAQFNKQAAGLDVEQMENDISLNIAQAYLQILFTQENVANAQRSLELIQAQLDQIDKMIEAGSRPRNARLDLVAQVAQNEQALIAAENDVILARLNLKQLLQLDDTYNLEIDVPAITLPSDYDIAALDAQAVYEQAMSWQPFIQAGEFRKQSAEEGVSLARTSMMPNLSFGGSMASRWSSFSRRQGPQIGTETVTQDIALNGEALTLSFEQPVFDINKVDYFDQLDENLAYGVGVNLSIPIYNQGQNKANLQLAKLDVARTDIANQQAKNQLKTDIQTAVADVRAGKKQYEAALRTAEATRAAYLDAEKQFNLGVSNSLDFVTAQNNRDRAETDLLIARYDYIFRLKVLDFYQGKEISLN